MADPSEFECAESQNVSPYPSQRTIQEARAPGVTRASQTLPGQEESAVDETLVRSKSRYRRSGLYTGIQQTTRPVTAPVEEQIDVVQRRQSKRYSQLAPIVQPNLQRKPSAKRYRDSYASPPISPPVNADIPEDLEMHQINSEWSDVEDRRRRLNARYNARRASPPASPVAPPPAEIQPSVKQSFPSTRAAPVQPLPSPVVFDGPPSSSEIRATKSMSALPTLVDSDEEEQEAGCFNLFKRRKVEPLPYTSEKRSMLRPKKSRELETIKPGGGGVVPGIDAPVSAVNAGDREVLVVCGKSKAAFAVTPTTTPVDILKSASKCMSERIDIRSAVLLEDFVTVGVQRPLRRYERIRDVMNSWDTDKQNSLILVDPGTGTSEPELSVTGVPQEKPGDESWLLEFSQKVGKWDKRVITLRSDGQITLQKDMNKPKEQTNLCHLSDFDIYRPTQEKMRKKIKPPKKYCFAVKSQQKTIMFESTHDFVHFFCTNDRPTADAFYAAVQEWRSWYLVNVMGEGRKPRQSKAALEKAMKDLEIGDDVAKTRKRQGSSEAQNRADSDKPREVDRLEKPATAAKSKELEVPASSGFTKSSNQFDTRISPERRTSTIRKQQYPPISMTNRLQLAEDEPLVNLGRKESVNRRRNSLDGRRSNSGDLVRTEPPTGTHSPGKRDVAVDRKETVKQRRPSIDRARSNPEEFAETGLLGRTYSQRRKDYTERETKESSPYTSGPNLLTSGYDTTQGDRSPGKTQDGLQRRNSTQPQQSRKASGDGGLQRSTSRMKKMQMPEPLIDLTPQYREPLQHSRKGKGFVPDKLGEGGLIDNATSPEDPLGIPPSTDWRLGRNAGNLQDPASALSRNATAARSTKRPARELPKAFTGDGLLAGTQAKQGWGKTQTGRGVMDGSRAKGPMVDLSVESIFAHGSLIAQVETAEGPPAPIIDRSRKED